VARLSPPASHPSYAQALRNERTATALLQAKVLVWRHRSPSGVMSTLTAWSTPLYLQDVSQEALSQARSVGVMVCSGREMGAGLRDGAECTHAGLCRGRHVVRSPLNLSALLLGCLSRLPSRHRASEPLFVTIRTTVRSLRDALSALAFGRSPLVDVGVEVLRPSKMQGDVGPRHANHQLSGAGAIVRRYLRGDVSGDGAVLPSQRCVAEMTIPHSPPTALTCLLPGQHAVTNLQRCSLLLSFNRHWPPSLRY